MVVMTPTMPMMMPRVVRTPRALLARIAPSAMPQRLRRVQAEARWLLRLVGRRTGAGSPAATGADRFDRVAVTQAVAQPDPPGVRGDVVLVGDQDDGLAGRGAARRRRHDLVAGLAVEVAGRLVGEDDATDC